MVFQFPLTKKSDSVKVNIVPFFVVIIAPLVSVVMWNGSGDIIICLYYDEKSGVALVDM